MKDGLGTYKWPDGGIYEGEWERNQMNGFVNTIKTIIFIINKIKHFFLQNKQSKILQI